MPGSDLDSAETYARLDAEGLYGRLAALPRQIEEAWAAGDALALPAEYARAEHIVVVGMGGSGIGGSLMQALAVDAGARVPVSVVRGYTLPAFVGRRTLVLASSNSGDTEETVSAFTAAADAGAMCLAVTTGGRLLDLAEKRGLPALRFRWEGEPRSALGWSTASLISVCGRLGLLPDFGPDLPGALQSMTSLLGEIGRDVPEPSNPAKQLARRLAGKAPVICGAQSLAPVAYRWRTQVNENAKSWALAEELPEMNHNAAVGYGLPAGLLPLLPVVILRHAAMHPRIALRVEATVRQMRDAGLAVEVLDVPGPSLLAQVLRAVEYGDFVSYYLGLLNGVHPSPTQALQWLKGLLASK